MGVLVRVIVLILLLLSSIELLYAGTSDGPFRGCGNVLDSTVSEGGSCQFDSASLSLPRDNFTQASNFCLVLSSNLFVWVSARLQESPIAHEPLT